MKDPLQTEPTPYEILGLQGTTPGRAEIQNAFKLALVRRVPVKLASRAQTELLDPVRRARHDLLQYDDECLRRLSPCPLDEPETLGAERRAATTASWENAYRRQLSDLDLAHCLAVLHHWWVRHEETRLSALVASGAPGERILEEARRIGHVWEGLIGYWCLLEAAPEFWCARCDLPEAQGSALAHDIVDSLRQLMLDRARHYAESDGRRPEALLDRYRDLPLALDRERRTAQAVIKANVRAGGMRLGCGVLILKRFDLADEVRAAVARHGLTRLGEALSPHADITMLLDSHRPADALERLDRLPEQERARVEVRDLRARALRALARQRASLDQWEEAVDAWAAALTATEDADLRARIGKDLVAIAGGQALKLGPQQRDAAIDLLDKVLELWPDEGLRARLADLLTDRGVQVFLQSEKRIDGGMPESIARLSAEAAEARAHGDWETAIARLRHALTLGPFPPSPAGEKGETEARARCEAAMKDLERAVALGSTRAREQLEAARSHAGEWDIAWHDRIVRQLSSAFANRGVGKANRAMDLYKRAAAAHRAKLDRLAGGGGKELSGLAMNVSPFQCCYPGCTGPRQYSVTTPSGRNCPLCEKHAEEFRKALRPPEGPDLLRAAQDDLLEALELQPDNEHARKNLETLREAMKEFEVPARRAARAAAAQPAPASPPTSAPPSPPGQARAEPGSRPAPAIAARRPVDAATARPVQPAAIVSVALGTIALVAPLLGLLGLLAGSISLSRERRRRPSVLLAIAGILLSILSLARWAA